MLEEALAKSDAKQDQAICKYYMALAYRKKGEINTAREWLGEAQKIDPQCVVHERVEKEIAQGAGVAEH
ncbi:MAG TPA: hypothetical protein VG733_05935 [Chthoniobacteraceae bacterium]|nr:hypothetical protein [Chthoniobacteraceae bacterium]